MYVTCTVQDDGLGRFVVSFAGGPYGAPFPDCMPPASLPEPSLHFIGDRDPVRKVWPPALSGHHTTGASLPQHKSQQQYADKHQVTGCQAVSVMMTLTPE